MANTDKQGHRWHVVRHGTGTVKICLNCQGNRLHPIARSACTHQGVSSEQ